MKRFLLAVIVLAFCTIRIFPAMPAADSRQSSGTIPVALVPAAFPVNFALYTAGEKQYVAFYDSAHRMALAVRTLTDSTWDFQELDSKVGWDSHNSMKPVHTMTGKDEIEITYPEFMRGPQGELIFHYRSGRSGSGFEVFNTWDSKKEEWRRLLDTPLTDGRGKMNAYMQGPMAGPDGFYHILWVWRDTPDCATNHTLSYARSKDLIHSSPLSRRNPSRRHIRHPSTVSAQRFPEWSFTKYSMREKHPTAAVTFCAGRHTHRTGISSASSNDRATHYWSLFDIETAQRVIQTLAIAPSFSYVHSIIRSFNHRPQVFLL